jgi:signal transduction histidine kinase
MWLDVLALAPQPDKLTKAVEAIKRNLARQTKLVGDLNDAAKVSCKGLEVRLGPLDLVTLLKGCIDAWQSTAIGKQLSFQHRIEVTSASVQGDPERLVQALNHVVENAVNCLPAGGRLEVRVRRVDDACVVEVEDTGGALSADDAAHLFEPLWRSAASAKSRSGVGLGLPVAHHIVTKHGGTLTASTGASGALLTLSLPLARADEPDAPAPPGTRPSSHEAR